MNYMSQDTETCRDLAPDQQMVFDADIKDLKKADQEHGLGGLESRVKFGLDPAGMLAVRDTLPLAEKVAQSLGTDVEKIWPLIVKLHKEGPWGSAEELSASADPKIRAYIVLAATCRETNWPGHTPEQYLKDRARVADELGAFTQDGFNERKEDIISKAQIDHIAGDGKVPVAEGDVALPLSLQGYKGCVAKAGEMRFAQTTTIADSLLGQHGLVKGFAEVFNPEKDGFERIAFDDPRSAKGRVVWVEKSEVGKKLDDMKPAAKRIAPGYVLTYESEDLAVRLVADSIRKK